MYVPVSHFFSLLLPSLPFFIGSAIDHHDDHTQYHNQTHIGSSQGLTHCCVTAGPGGSLLVHSFQGSVVTSEVVGGSLEKGSILNPSEST